MVLVGHVISQEPMIKGSLNLWVQPPQRKTHRGSGYIMGLVYHVTEEAHNIMGMNCSKIVTILQSLMAIATVVVEI